MKYNKDYLEKLDKKIEMIPLTVDSAFKSVMTKNTKIFKKFLIETLDININPSDSNLIFLDKELIKENYKEHGKTVDLNVKLGSNLLINVEVNRRDYETIRLRNKLYLEKLHTMQYEVGEEYKNLSSDYIYQLNLNYKDKSKNIGENIIVSYDITSNKIFDDNLKIYIKHLEYYKNMFYTNPKSMTYDEIFMSGIMSSSFTELYNIMKNILSTKELNRFMGSVINMSKEYFPIHEWEKEKMDKLVRDKEREIAIKEGHDEGIEQGLEQGLEQGIEQGIEQGREENTINVIKIMLKKKMSYQDISEISGKSIKDIKEIEKDITE